MTALLTVETIEEGMTIKKTTGSVLHATMSTFLGEQNATAAEKANMGTSKPTNPPSETTTAQTIVDNVHNRNVMDVTIGFAHLVVTTTSHSEQNATNVESQNQEGTNKDAPVGAFQIVINEVQEIQTVVEEAVMEAVHSVETVVQEIQTVVEEAVMEAVDSVATEAPAMTGEILEEDVQTVTVTMSALMSAIERPEESVQAMHTTEDLNLSVLDAIKAKIETTEVNRHDSRSTLLGCA